MEPELEREVQRGNPNDPGAARIVPTAGSGTSGNFSLAPLFLLSRGRERRLVCSNCVCALSLSRLSPSLVSSYCYDWWVLCRTQSHDSAQGEIQRVKRFTIRVRYTGRQSNNCKQNQTGNKQENSCMAGRGQKHEGTRGTRGTAEKTRNIPYNNNLRRRNEKQENKDYIYTQATDNAGQVRTIKAGQTKTQVDYTRGINRTQVKPKIQTNREIGNR